MNEKSIKVENSEQLIELLNGMLPAVRSTVVMEALLKGAASINQQAQSKLYASKKGQSKTGYSYYATAFKKENMKAKTPEEIGVRTGVFDKKQGYKLRWLEWGTAPRKTFSRKNAITKTVTPRMNRGKITATNFFYSSVRGQQDQLFKIISESVIQSLENLTTKQNG